MRKWLAIAALVVLSACAMSQPRTFTGQFEPPPANSRVLLMTPDVSLSMLTASGLMEARADWSENSRQNLADSITAAMQTRSHTSIPLDPATAMDGRQGQIIRLHQAVGSSIVAIDYMHANIPTRRGRFDIRRRRSRNPTSAQCRLRTLRFGERFLCKLRAGYGDDRDGRTRGLGPIRRATGVRFAGRPSNREHYLVQRSDSNSQRGHA